MAAPFKHKNSKGKEYILHSRKVTLRGGREQTIYFFACEKKEGFLTALPAGKVIVENEKTGLPMLKNA